ncbi:MAG: oligosaccharide flippase family protein [Methanothrix sp.]
MKLARATGTIYMSSIIVMLLGFISVILVVRITTQSEFGTYSLATTIISIIILVSSLGLGEGVTRYIAYFRGTEEINKIKDTITSSVQIALISGSFFLVLSILIAPIISNGIFKNPELLTPLRLLAISIPFSVLITIYIAIFRGFDKIMPSAYFSVMKSLGLLILLIAYFVSGSSINGAILANILSVLVTCIAFSIYFGKKLPMAMARMELINIRPMCFDLLSFSIPLLAVNMLMSILTWTDTLMIGYFKTPELVGLYNVAPPLAYMNTLFLTSLGALYVPIASKLYSQNRLNDLKKIYATSTKWCFIGTLPLAIIFILLPEVVLDLLYGPRYIGAAPVLQIMTLGIMLCTISGPSFYALIAMGKTGTITRAYLLSCIANIVLNAVLIQQMGITGAAIASALSIAIGGIALLVGLYRHTGMHPLTPEYIKIIATSFIAAAPVYLISQHPPGNGLLELAGGFILAASTHVILIIITKSLDREDLILVRKARELLESSLSSLRRAK